MQILNISVMNRPARFVTTTPYPVMTDVRYAIDAQAYSVRLRYMGVYPIGSTYVQAQPFKVVLRSILIKHAVLYHGVLPRATGYKVIKRSLLQRLSVRFTGGALPQATGYKVIKRSLLVRYTMEAQCIRSEATGYKVIKG